MFGLVKLKSGYDKHTFESAKSVYAKCLEQTQNPVFYTQYNVSDNFEGRFEILILHVFTVMQALGSDKAFNQALFDVMFGDMDQTLRVMGIGDMGVPKHMRRMMKAFNGHVQKYDAAIKEGSQNLVTAINKNIFTKNPDEKSALALALYTISTITTLEKYGSDAIKKAEFYFDHSED